MKAPHYSSDAQNATTLSENTPSGEIISVKNGESFWMGKSESQKGQRLTLKCPSCNRVLRIYYKRKTVASPAKLIVLDGSVHQKETTTRIYVRCKCGNKVIFERQSPDISRYAWRRISQETKHAI
jgi:RNase P subunit RPR2